MGWVIDYDDKNGRTNMKLNIKRDDPIQLELGKGGPRVKKRDRRTIEKEILVAAVQPSNKTRLVYQANLNFKTAIPYLDELIRKELLNFVDSRLYVTTPKGLGFIRAVKRLEKM